eukprot:m.105551 g.105551  ORF g.105551 m.105551 type:complete len:627 (-) comp14199_c0_seq3:25-1905(-)
MAASILLLSILICGFLCVESNFDIKETANTHAVRFLYEPMENSEGSPTFPMTNFYGQKFACFSREEGNASTRNASALLEKLNGTCFRLASGWWNYYACIGQRIEQYHAESVNGVLQVVTNISLGVFAGESEGVQQYVNGTTCDLVGVSRSAVLHTRCGRVAGLASVAETASCVYEATLQLPELCQPTPSHSVSCYHTPPAQPAAPIELRAGQRWDGVYDCQGTQRLSIVLYDVNKRATGGTHARAVCGFVHRDAKHWGAFQCELNQVDSSLTMTPLRWVQQPSGFISVQLKGTLNGNEWVGITPECSNSFFKLIASNTEVPADLSSLPALARADGSEWRSEVRTCFSKDCDEVCSRDIGPFTPACLEHLWARAGCVPEGAFAPSHAPAAQISYWHGLVLLDLFGDMKHIRAAASPGSESYRRCIDAKTVPQANPPPRREPDPDSSVPPSPPSPANRADTLDFTFINVDLSRTAVGGLVAAALGVDQDADLDERIQVLDSGVIRVNVKGLDHKFGKPDDVIPPSEKLDEKNADADDTTDFIDEIVKNIDDDDIDFVTSRIFTTLGDDDDVDNLPDETKEAIKGLTKKLKEKLGTIAEKLSEEIAREKAKAAFPEDDSDETPRKRRKP